MDGSGHPGFKIKIALAILIKDPNAFPSHHNGKTISYPVPMSPRQDKMG
jgi:hypothetical protein